MLLKVFTCSSKFKKLVFASVAQSKKQKYKEATESFNSLHKPIINQSLIYPKM